MRIIAVSGYFDPLHVGHIELFKLARALGDKLVVIVNNDKQTELKKGTYFMPAEERKKILIELECVDDVFISIDEDRSVCRSLQEVHPHVFANGGDRHNYEIPEAKICRELGIEIVDGLGDKIQSSSELIKRFNENKENNKQ
jgi:cytidyltransferase-like protein